MEVCLLITIILPTIYRYSGNRTQMTVENDIRRKGGFRHIEKRTSQDADGPDVSEDALQKILQLTLTYFTDFKTWMGPL